MVEPLPIQIDVVKIKKNPFCRMDNLTNINMKCHCQNKNSFNAARGFECLQTN